MSSRNIHPSLFSPLQNEAPLPPRSLLFHLSSSASSIATKFFNSINFFLLSFQEEKRRGIQFLTASPSLQKIKNIFTSAHKPVASPEEKGSKLLGGLLQRIETKPQNISTAAPFYEKKDSLLGKGEARTPSLTITTFASLFGLNHSSSTSSFKELVDYIGNYFILQKNEKVPPFLFPALQQAVVEKGEFEKLIASKDRSALILKAEKLARSMETIQEGNPFIYIGDVSRGEGTNKLLESLTSQLLPKELQSSLLNNSFKETLQKKISELFQNNENISGLKGLKGELSSNLIGEKLECIFPKTWAMAVQKSIEQDCKELMFGQDALSNPETFAEKLWNRMSAEGLEDMLKTSLEELLTKGEETYKAESKNIFTSLKQSLPSEAVTLLGILGYDAEESTISIEIQRQKNGKLTLTLFSKPTPFRPHQPLVYSDLDPKVLGKEFFYRLLSYQALPAWERGVISYSLDDFFEGLMAELGKEPLAVENTTPIREMTNWTLTELFLHHHLKLNPKEFQLTLYNLRLQAFQDMWNEREVKQNSTLQSTLKSALDLLVKESVKLFDENLLPFDHLKAIYATVKEWEEITKKEVTQFSPLPKTTLPPVLQNILAETLSLCEITNEQISLVKEAFISLLGEEVEEQLNFAIAEILPTMPKKNPRAEPVKQESFRELFSNEIKTISSMRVSLLSFYKLYARYSQGISQGLNFFASTKILSSLLQTHIPIFAAHPKAAMLCAPLLSAYGPTSLSAIIPENVSNLISSLYAFYGEVIGYLRSRIAVFVIKHTIYHLLGSDQITHIHHLIKDTQQKTTRDGEISYEIRTSQTQTAKYHFIKNPPPLDLKEASSFTEMMIFPEPVALTKDNLLHEIWRWIYEVNTTSRQSIYYYNSMIRTLPIPKRGTPTLWDEVEATTLGQVLEDLHALTLAIHERAVQFPNVEAEETMISLFALYSIIDYLARRSPEAHLSDEWKPNGCDLMVLLSNPFTKIKNARTYSQLESLAAYFDFDIRKRYSEKEIDEKRQTCLFNYYGYGLKRNISMLTYKGSDDVRLENTFFPRDAKYYKRLLEDPSIQAKLETHLGKEARDWEKYFCLFRDPPMREKNDLHPVREGILPRPFYLLRFMHALLASRTIGANEFVTELNFTPITKDTFTGWPTLDKILQIGKESFHLGTLHAFRNLTLTPTIKNFGLHLNFIRFDLPTSFPGGESTARIRRYVEKIFFQPCRLGFRKQDEIMQSTEIYDSKLREEEKKILEMVTSHKSDQVIRAIGYFTHNLEKLSEPEFQLIFDLFIHNVGALQSQISDHPEIVSVLGAFFHKGLHHFLKSQDYATCLYLTEVGGEALLLSKKFKNDAATFFPDFRLFIREKIIPEIQNGPSSKESVEGPGKGKTTDHILQSLDFLAASYNEITPSELEGPLLEEALVDIARFSFSRLTSDHSITSEKAVFSFSPLIRKAMDTNPPFRTRIIEAILKDANIPFPQNYEGKWEGIFPNFQSGELKIGLLSRKSDHFFTKNDDHLLKILGKSVGKSILLHDSLIYYPDHQITVEIEDKQCKITKAFGPKGIKCRLTSCKEETGQKIWIEENPKSKQCIVVFTEGAELKDAYYARHVKEEEGEGIELLSKYPMLGETENRIDLRENEHGLSLLSWFQPLDKISAFSPLESPEKLSRIEFREIENGSDNSQKLIFTVENNKAVSEGAFPGFSIASKQKDLRLSSYSSYLLLENEREEKKVLLVAQPIQSYLLSFFAKHFADLSTSPFVQSLLTSFLSTGQKEKPKYYVYTVNTEGKLETKDPNALAYLFIHHLMQGNHEELFSALGQLEIIGKLSPFPNSVLDLFALVQLPLLILQTDAMNEISLRLVSMRIENELFHPQKRKSNVTLPYYLEYFFIQRIYVAYLTGLEEGKAPYLTEIQELFLLKELEEKNKWLLYSHVSKRISLDSMAGSLFLPIIAKRSLFLRAKYSDESYWKIKGESLLQEVLSEYLNPSAFSLGMGGTGETNTLAKIAKLASKQASNPFRAWYSSATIKDWARELVSDQKLEDLPLEIWEITPSSIKSNFLLYYRLATKSIPPEWKENQEKETLFAQRSATFHRTLPLLKGTYHELPGILIPILQTVAKGSFFTSFPKAERLEEKMNLARRYQRCQEKIKGAKVESLSISKCEEEELAKESRELEKNGDPLTNFENFFEIELIRSCKAANLSDIFHKQTVETAISMGTSTLKWMAPPLLFAALGLGEWAALFQTARFGWGLFRRVTKMNDPEVQEKKATLKKENLPPPLAERMTQKEGQINFVMEELFAKYFEEDTSKGNTDPFVPIDTSSFTIETKEESIQASVEKLRQSVKDYYDRPEVANHGCRFKEGKEAEKLKKKIGAMQKEVHAYLALEEKEIVSLVNPILDGEGESERERMKNKLKGLIKKETPLSFEKICTLFARGQEEELLKRSGMTEATLQTTREKLYFRLLLLSRFNLLAKTAREKGVEEIGRELKRRRVYNFTNTPEKLIRGKLLFETNEQVLLWDKPNQQLETMLFSPHTQSVTEAIMGSGKSFFIIPEVSHYVADGTHLICNVWPAPVAKNAIQFIGAQAKRVYRQTASAFHCCRSTPWTATSLWGVYQVFKQTLFEGEQMNTTKEDLQAFELLFLEEGLDVDGSRRPFFDRKEKLSYYMKTLALLRNSGKGNIDEPHIQFDPKKERNHPVGKGVRINEGYTDLMKEILLLLVTLPEIREIVGVKNKKPSPLDPEVFKKKVLPILASYVARIDSLHIPKEQQGELITYLMGQAKTIPPFVLQSKERSLIGLAKGMLTVLLPHCLERIVHVDFALSSKGNGDYARPSEGNENPSETSNIRNPYEAFVKTGLLKLHDGLTNEEILTFIQILQDKGKKQEERNHISFENTTYARFFKKICPNYDLANFFALTPKERTVIVETFQKSDAVTMTYVAWVIGPQIKYYQYNLKSDSYNFASMFQSFYSYDGSPNKEACFPHKTHVHWDKGTMGESVDYLVKNCKESSISILKKETPEKVLKEVITDFFQKKPNMRAMIDRGAIFNGMKNEKVAEELLHYIKTNREDLQGVVFYNSDKELVILEKGGKKQVPLEESTIPKEKRLTYFDQCHTYAADVPQQVEGEAVISVGEDLTMEQLAQAIWRMRGLKNANQKLTFVMTGKTKKLISGDRNPTIEDIIKFAAKNEALLLADYAYSADRQKLQNVVRRAILDKIILAKDVDQALAIMQEFKDILLTKIEDDPFILYGFIDAFESPATLITELRTALYNRIEKSPTFTEVEKKEIDNQLKEIGNGTYPKEVHTYRIGGKLDGNKLDDLGKTTEMNTDGSNEVDEDQNHEVNQNLQQQTQNELSEKKGPSFWPWLADLTPSDLSWLQVSPIPGAEGMIGGLFYHLSRLKKSFEQVPIFSFKEALASAQDPALQEIATAFDSSILATNNFFQLIDIGMKGGYVDPYSKFQKPTFEALIIQEEKHGKKERKILLLDQEEAEYWRNKLREEKKEERILNPKVKLGLYDLTSKTLVITGKNPLTNRELHHPHFENIILQLNFLSGRTNYTKEEQKILLPWLQKNKPEKLKATFLNIHENHGQTPYQGSDLEDLFYMAKGMPQEMSIRV